MGWIQPRDARVQANLTPQWPSRRPHRIPHTGEEDMLPEAQEIATNSEDQPALVRQIGQSFDVSGMLVRVGPMGWAVILDADLPSRPAHVDAADKGAVLIDDNDLRLRFSGNRRR
ncbi:MAG TPA: hypothetical protein VFK56_12220 [Mycobacterium sp.]|nr:hypothetical protein [Mycobacterium sp.]